MINFLFGPPCITTNDKHKFSAINWVSIAKFIILKYKVLNTNININTLKIYSYNALSFLQILFFFQLLGLHHRRTKIFKISTVILILVHLLELKNKYKRKIDQNVIEFKKKSFCTPVQSLNAKNVNIHYLVFLKTKNSLESFNTNISHQLLITQ